MFLKSFLKYSLPMSVSEDTIKNIGHCACLRELVGKTSQTYASTNPFLRASFHGTFFGSWKQGFLK